MSDYRMQTGHDRLPSGIEPGPDGWPVPPACYRYARPAPRPIRDYRPVPWYSWATLGCLAAALATGLGYAVAELVRVLH